jgi:hypothetical protein
MENFPVFMDCWKILSVGIDLVHQTPGYFPHYDLFFRWICPFKCYI